MKKIWIVLLSLLVLVGCSDNAANTVENVTENSEVERVEDTQDQVVENEVEEADTFIYESESGPVTLPSDPERIVVLDSSAAGAILLFDGDVVGHEPWTGKNTLFEPYLKNSTEISVDSLEQIMALQPDLIVVSSFNEDIDLLNEIAPTVAFTYGRLNYLDTILEYGKLVNKEEQAQKWIEAFTEKASVAGDAFRVKFGDDVTVSVMEAYGEEIYLYGDNWGRGTQVVYQAMNLNMTDQVKADALEAGYYAISSEVVSNYAADLMILSEFEGSNTSFLDTEVWQSIPAVENDLVLRVNGESFYMTGPITLDYQLETIERFFLN